MKLNFDSQFNPEPWTIVLCHRNLEKIGILHNISELKGSFNLNEPQEISFELHKKLNDIEEALWDEVYNLRVIWVKELNAYFQIELDIADTQVDNIKSITATSLCEAELSQIMLYGIEINTEEDITNFIKLHPDEDYEAAVFWNKEHPEKGLLYRVLEKAPHYTVKHVDDSLANLQRNDISIDGTSIYDWLTGECAKMFDCIFQFDSTDRSISVYDLFSVCENLDCSYYLENHKKYRESFTDFCPKCGSRHITVFGRDTGIVVDTKNLTEEVNFSTDVDTIKNAFRLEAGDEYMTDAVRACNPNGSEYLYYFSDEMYHDMTPALVQKLRDYDDLWNSYQDEYEELMEDIYDILDEEGQLEHSMSPTRTTADMNATTEIANLTTSNLSPIVLQSISSANLTAVTNAIINYSKCFFRSGYFKVKALETTYNTSTHVWTGKLKIINNSDPANAEDKDAGDVATTPMLSIQVYGGDQNPVMYEKFIQQKMEKIIAQDTKREKDNVVFQLLKPYITLENFVNYIRLWSLNALDGFAKSIDSCKTSMMELGLGADKEEKMSEDQKRATNNIWKPYYNKYVAIMGGYYYDDIYHTNYIVGEYNTREAQLKAKQEEESQLRERQDQIHDILNFKNYLGETLFNEFCAFKREDTYQNSNYISDLFLLDDGSGNYDNAGLFDNARKFIVEANKQIRISGEYQHSIESNLYNLLIMDEFKDLTEHFELGNFIRVRSDGDIYRLRLIHYEVDFDDLSTLNTEFSDMTKTGDSLNDVKSILDSARSMATSYGYTQRAAISGGYAYGTLEEFRREGLKSALYKISNNDSEEITYDHTGLMAKSYDDITDSYLDKQLRITHNIMAFTDDNWKTVKMAMGNFGYYDENGDWREGYGINASFVVSGFIQGTTIVGGQLYSPIATDQNGNSYHMTHFDLENGDIEIGIGTEKQFIYSSGDNKLLLKGGRIEAGTIEGSTITGSSIIGDSISGGTITGTDFNNGNGTFHVDANGHLTASGATINGNSTFSGTLSAATGTFAGDISAATGHFTGIVDIKEGANIGNWHISGGNIVSYNNSVSLNGIDGSISGTSITGGSLQTSTESNNSSHISLSNGWFEVIKGSSRLGYISSAKKSNYTGTHYGIRLVVDQGDYLSLGRNIDDNSSTASSAIVLNNGLNPYLNGDYRYQNIILWGSTYIYGDLKWTPQDYTLDTGEGGYGNINIGQGSAQISAKYNSSATPVTGSGNIATPAYVKAAVYYLKNDDQTIKGSYTFGVGGNYDLCVTTFKNDVYFTSEYIYFTSLKAYDSGSPNTYVGVNSHKFHTTTKSSRRYKNSITTNISDRELDPHNLYDLNICQFKFNSDYLSQDDPHFNKNVIGFIAEEVNQIYPIACEYQEGTKIPENWNFRYIVPPMLKLVQEQHEEIEELKLQNQNLQSQINLIMNRIYQIENQR